MSVVHRRANSVVGWRGHRGASWRLLLMSHPPLAERINALRNAPLAQA